MGTSPPEGSCLRLTGVWDPAHARLGYSPPVAASPSMEQGRRNRLMTISDLRPQTLNTTIGGSMQSSLADRISMRYLPTFKNKFSSPEGSSISLSTSEEDSLISYSEDSLKKRKDRKSGRHERLGSTTELLAKSFTQLPRAPLYEDTMDSTIVRPDGSESISYQRKVLKQDLEEIRRGRPINRPLVESNYVSHSPLSLSSSSSRPSFELEIHPIPVKAVKGVSALTMQLKADQVRYISPLESRYRSFSGEEDIQPLKLLIYRPSSNNPKDPFVVTIRGSATVEETIGYSLYCYEVEGREPKLCPDEHDVSQWTLRIIDDGELPAHEVDMEQRADDDVYVEERSNPAPHKLTFSRNEKGIIVGDWSILTCKLPISSSREIDEAHKQLGIPLPEMLFGRNKIEVAHLLTDWRIEFTTFGALATVDRTKVEFQVAHSDQWKRGRQQREKEEIKKVQNIYDWTYSTSYKGDVLGGSKLTFAQSDNVTIPYNKLRNLEPILFYEEIDLYEDELADNGIALLKLKVRVMPKRLLLLCRYFLKLDGVIIRTRDTRIYIDFEMSQIIREYTTKEAPYATIRQPPELSTTKQVLLSWSMALRQVSRQTATSAFVDRLSSLKSSQHEHERQWFNGRKNIIEKYDARRRMNSIIKTIGGNVPQSSKSSLDEELEKELGKWDNKVAEAFNEMVRAQMDELIALGVPYFPDGPYDLQKKMLQFLNDLVG